MTTKTRTCEQCGVMFTPMREHARFCSAACRVAWNRAMTGEPVIGVDPLRWSVPAVRSATQQLADLSASDLSPSDLSPSDLSPSDLIPPDLSPPDLSPLDRRAALAAISDALWAVTMVDAAM